MATIIEAVGVVEGRGRRGRSARKLADAAADLALERAGLAPGDIELLLNAGLYHDRILGEPALAALIQEDIGANPEDPHDADHGTFSFDVANGACGMLTSLQVADGFLRAGTIRHALVVASDADPGHHLAADFPFDGAGAAVVCGWRDGPAGIAGFRFADLARDGASPAGTGQLDEGLHATVVFENGRNTLTFEEQPGFDATAGALAGEVASALLTELGHTPDDVDLIVANPLTTGFLDALAARLGVPPERVGAPLDRRRVHTAGLGVALEAATGDGTLDGRSALLVSAGAGPTAGAALLQR